MKQIISISFLIFIFGIGINNYLIVFDSKSENENRTLASKPVVDIKHLDKYPAQYDAYLNDNFSGRSFFIDQYKNLTAKLFKKETVSTYFIQGKDNFIFEMRKNLPVFTGKISLSDHEIALIGKEFQERDKYFKSLGIKMYIQLIPIKYKVYKEKLPLLLTAGSNNMGDKFVNYFNDSTDISLIYHHDLLKSKVDSFHVFHKYDTHWNGLGSYFANQELTHRIKEDFPSMTILDTSIVSISPFEREGGNMKVAAKDQNDTDFGYKIEPKNKTIKLANGYTHPCGDFRYGQYEYCKRYKSDNKNNLKVLIFRDSFANFSIPYFPELFSETLYIWDDWHYKFNKEIVDIEKPDIIIYSLYETYINRILSTASFVESETKNQELQ